MLQKDICIRCGACCAFYRVSFYWSEADSSLGGTVPADFTEPLPPWNACMKGTKDFPVRCVALQGEVGKNATCSIYEKRSSTCREFGLNWVDGKCVATPIDLIRCNRARAKYGLPLISPNEINDNTPPPIAI